MRGKPGIYCCCCQPGQDCAMRCTPQNTATSHGPRKAAACYRSYGASWKCGDTPRDWHVLEVIACYALETDRDSLRGTSMAGAEGQVRVLLEASGIIGLANCGDLGLGYPQAEAQANKCIPRHAYMHAWDLPEREREAADLGVRAV